MLLPISSVQNLGSVHSRALRPPGPIAFSCKGVRLHSAHPLCQCTHVLLSSFPPAAFCFPHILPAARISGSVPVHPPVLGTQQLQEQGSIPECTTFSSLVIHWHLPQCINLWDYLWICPSQWCGCGVQWRKRSRKPERCCAGSPLALQALRVGGLSMLLTRTLLVL